MTKTLAELETEVRQLKDDSPGCVMYFWQVAVTLAVTYLMLRDQAFIDWLVRMDILLKR